jgi:hypothetical protein
MPERLESDVRDFLRRYVESVEQLEALLLLRSREARDWSAREAAEALGVSAASARASLEALVIAGAVYFLCAVTSAACAVLLLRAYRTGQVRLLLWSGLCFALLAVDNVLLFVDLVLAPNVSLVVWRRLAAFSGLCLLVYGLVRDSR